MDFTVEELSPVSKKIVINVPAQEVTSAFTAAARHFQRDIALPGFRRGKVPLSTVERRYAAEIINRVGDSFLGDKLTDFLRESNMVPVGRPDYDPSKLERGADFSCAITLEVLPDFEIPEYAGLEVEQEDATPSQKELDATITRLMRNMAEEKDVAEARLPKDGDFVEVDYEGFDENGQAVPDVNGKNFKILLGETQILPDFENLIKTTMPGAKNEGMVSFPADYAHKPLQGKSVTMRITLNALKEQILPELNDELAKNYGQESLESLKEAIYQSLFSQNKKTMKSKAQQKLMDMLLPKLNFMLPPSLVKTREERILSEARHRLSMPADNEAMEKTIEAMRPAAVKEAELFTRVHIFLIKIAEKENLSVDRREAEMHLYQMAVREGADLSKLREAYERSGLMEELMERILADKAMDFIYDKAVVKNLTPEREEKKAEAKE